MKPFCRLWGLALVFLSVLPSFGQNTEVLQYRLSSGDQVQIVVYGEADLGVSQRIDDTGKIVMPLLGEVMLNGLTVREAESMIEGRFKSEDYLVKPEVTVQVTGSAARQFLIFGEVRAEGMKQFPPNKSRISIIEAIALAGNFTDFAKSNAVEIKRYDENGQETKITVDVRQYIRANQSGGQATPVDVLPGDIIFVPQKFM